MPLLWAQCLRCFRAPHPLREMLRRVGEDVPLFLRFCSGSFSLHEPRSPWEMIETLATFWPDPHRMAFLSRIRALSILDTEAPKDVSDTDEAALSILDEHLSLEVLEVHFLELHPWDINEDKFAGSGATIIKAPKLREVRFTNYFIPWTAPGLTHLSLALASADSGIPSHILCDALSLIAPTIQVLELNYCLPAEGNYPPILKSFPHLRQLYLRDQDDCVNDFVEALDRATMTVTRLELILDPTPHWRDVFNSAIKKALKLFLTKHVLNTLTITPAYIENQRVTPVTEHMRLMFSPQSSDPDTVDLGLVMAIENASCIFNAYALCLSEMYDAASSIIMDIWKHIEILQLDLPFWGWVNLLPDLLVRLANVREYHIVDPIHLNGDQVKWSIPLPGLPSASDLPTSHIEVLNIVANGRWKAESIKSYCYLLNMNMTSAFIDSNGDLNRSHKRPLIGLLCLNFAQKAGAVEESDEEQLSEERLVASFNRAAERVQLCYL